MFLKIFSLLVPNPAGAIWIAALVAFMVFADHSLAVRVLGHRPNGSGGLLRRVR